MLQLPGQEGTCSSGSRPRGPALAEAPPCSSASGDVFARDISITETVSSSAANIHGISFHSEMSWPGPMAIHVGALGRGSV